MNLSTLIKMSSTIPYRYLIDKSRRHHTFDIGDWVLLHRQAYLQTSLLARGQNKLSRKFYGPYPISRCIGEVVYELLLPPSSKIHPMFHISLLKPYHGPKPPSSFHMPQEDVAPSTISHTIPTLCPTSTNIASNSTLSNQLVISNPTQTTSVSTTCPPSTTRVKLHSPTINIQPRGSTPSLLTFHLPQSCLIYQLPTRIHYYPQQNQNSHLPHLLH